MKADDWARAKSRATDLERAWDEAQDTLQPMNPAKWTEMDLAIDAVLKTARSSSHDAAATGAALQALTGVIDSLDQKP